MHQQQQSDFLFYLQPKSSCNASGSCNQISSPCNSRKTGPEGGSWLIMAFSERFGPSHAISGGEPWVGRATARNTARNSGAILAVSLAICLAVSSELFGHIRDTM